MNTTLNGVIERLTELRKEHGGDVRVRVYDGEASTLGRIDMQEFWIVRGREKAKVAEIVIYPYEPYPTPASNTSPSSQAAPLVSDPLS